jgi:acyl-CoA thioesterase I
VISILIGVNDTWRRYDSNDPTEAKAYERDYRALLEKIAQHLKARVVLLEPFLLHVPEDRHVWREREVMRVRLFRTQGGIRR